VHIDGPTSGRLTNAAFVSRATLPRRGPCLRAGTPAAALFRTQPRDARLTVLLPLST